MKTITVSDETYEFLRELQNRRKEGDNRGTADVFYGIKTKEYQYGINEYDDDDAEMILTRDESMLILEDLDDPEEIADLEYRYEINFKEAGIDTPEEILDYLKDRDWTERCRRLSEKVELCYGTGFFLSEQAVFDYVMCNQHNLHDPVTWGFSAYNNSELQGIIKFIEEAEFSDGDDINSEKP